LARITESERQVVAATRIKRMGDKERAKNQPERNRRRNHHMRAHKIK